MFDRVLNMLQILNMPVCSMYQGSEFTNVLNISEYAGIIPGFVWLCLNVSKISNLLLSLGAKRVGGCESYPTSEIPKICSYLWCFFNNLFIFSFFFFFLFIFFLLLLLFFRFLVLEVLEGINQRFAKAVIL